jgi:DNA repair protein RecO (recombination protein O)
VTLYRDHAIVLRTHKLGEADRIITLFTKEHGRIRAVAKGVRRTKSKFGARLEPGSYVDCQIYTGKGMEIITQAEAIENYGDSLSQDYQRWTILHAIIEAVEKFTLNEYEKSSEQFALMHGAINALASESYDPSLILDAYLLRALSLAGFAPSFSTCSVCEKPGPHRYFSMMGGGSICDDCKTSAAATPDPLTLDLMDALMNSDWKSAVNVELKNRREASGLIAAYLQWHLEHGLRTLVHVERSPLLPSGSSPNNFDPQNRSSHKSESA